MRKMECRAVYRTKQLHGEIISKAKGFISWEQYLQDNVWIDFVLWETQEDADNATKAGQELEVTKNFYDCIQMTTCGMLISQFVIKY